MMMLLAVILMFTCAICEDTLVKESDISHGLSKQEAAMGFQKRTNSEGIEEGEYGNTLNSQKMMNKMEEMEKTIISLEKRISMMNQTNAGFIYKEPDIDQMLEDIKQNKIDIGILRNDMDVDMDAISTQMTNQIAALTSTHMEDIAVLTSTHKEDMAAISTEMTNQITGLKTEMTNQILAVSNTHEHDIKNIAEDITSVRNDISALADDIMSVRNQISAFNLAPIGTIIAWTHKPNFDSRHSVGLPEGWVECDGRQITEGVWTGQKTPHINSYGSSGLFLRGGTTEYVLETEDDQVKQLLYTDHTFHARPDKGFSCWAQNGAGACKSCDGDCDWRKTSSISGTEGDETRPKNIRVIYIMKIK